MRNFLRFLFSTADQARIDAGSLLLEEIPYSAAPALGAPYPQSLRLSFTIKDPANGPIALRPLFPGELTFVVDSAAPGNLPTPDQVNFTSADYANWKTAGFIRVKAIAKIYQEIAKLASGLEVNPNTVWYSPIKISEDFLFVSLRQRLDKAVISGGGGLPTIKKDHPQWAQHAVSRFLAGTYSPELRLKTNADDDDIIAHPMPVVTMAANGNVELLISAALARTAQDFLDTKFDDLAPGAKLTDPAHPRNGAIPARHVYRKLRPHMIAAETGNTIPDKALVDWPTAPRFFPLRFTRTWKPIENVSVLFPAQTARVENAANNTLLFEQRMPAHGVVYVAQAPASPAPNAPNIRVAIAGGLRLLNGATTEAWRAKAGTAPLVFDLSTAPAPHIILRQRMREEMFVREKMFGDNAPRPGGLRCTYMSIRRTIRALLDHRITGGRLNFRLNVTDQTTLDLMTEAWQNLPESKRPSPNLVKNNKPLPSDPPGKARSLEPIFRAFFPDNAPAETIDGSDHRDPDKIFDQGQVCYNLWQTIEDVIFSAGFKRNFLHAHVARGGASALVSVGLGNFHLDPVRQANETDAAYFDRIVGAMLTGLEPGAILQFWKRNADYENIKARTASPTDIGHSPVFFKYMADANNDGVPDGIVVIDQFGASDCPVIGTTGNRLLRWGGHQVQIWASANWDE